MATVYEGMFLLDNQVVREDWKRAKTLVTGMIEKHGGNVITARRWDERRLAYPIKGKQRATYLLTYYELPGNAMPATRRDFDLSEPVLRYLWLAVDGVPEAERALAEAENAADFAVPEPPEDDAQDEAQNDDEVDENARKSRDDGSDDSSDDDDSDNQDDTSEED